MAVRAVRRRQSGRHGGEAFAKEHRIGRRLAQVNGGDRRHGDMGCGQRGCIVQPVADHQHGAPLALQGSEPGDLATRIEVGGIVGNPQFVCDHGNGRLVIAGEDLDPEAARLQIGDDLNRIRAQSLTHGEEQGSAPSRARTISEASG